MKMTQPQPQNVTVPLLRILMQEAAAVPLQAVLEMKQKHIQAQAALTQQSLGVQKHALRQQKERMRMQRTLQDRPASSADADPLRKPR